VDSGLEVVTVKQGLPRMPIINLDVPAEAVDAYCKHYAYSGMNTNAAKLAFAKSKIIAEIKDRVHSYRRLLAIEATDTTDPVIS